MGDNPRVFASPAGLGRLRPAQQDRPGRCRSDLRGGEPAVDALCADQERGRPGDGLGAPGARAADRATHHAAQRASAASWPQFGVVARPKGPAHRQGAGRDAGSRPRQPARDRCASVLLGLASKCWPSSIARSSWSIDARSCAWHRANRARSRRTSPPFPALARSCRAHATAAWWWQPAALRRRARPRPPGSGWRLGAEPPRRRQIRLGRISKQGDGYLRRLLINGAQAVLGSKRAKTDPWLKRLLDTKPRLVAAVALANKMARIAWAVMVRQTRFREAVACRLRSRPWPKPHREACRGEDANGGQRSTNGLGQI